jgi:tRNA threonylcarbamoyladenosine modification (KEOPS) complex Cgi121 subunit
MSCNRAVVVVIENAVVMRAIVYAQFHPVKTMKQFISDRGLYRSLILAMLVANWCF